MSAGATDRAGRVAGAVARGRGLPRALGDPHRRAGVIAVLVESLALVLVLASSGTPRARPGLDAQPDNAARARRGLLPRKIAKTRPPARARRAVSVILPQAPTWLGEPGEVTAPAVEAVRAPPGEVAVEPAVAAVEPVIATVDRIVAPVAAVAAPVEEPAELRASLEGVEVGLLLVRRLPVEEGEAIQAALAEPEVEAAIVRREASPDPR